MTSRRDAAPGWPEISDPGRSRPRNQSAVVMMGAPGPLAPA
jgi:hypothetical protein